MALIIGNDQEHISGGAHMLLLTVPFLVVIYVVGTWLQQCHVPGPFLSSISNLPRLFWVRSGNAHQIHIELHQKYGKLVRFGPNNISVGDATELQKIYGIKANLQKSDFYQALQPMQKGHIIQGLVNTQDDKLHRAMKKPIAGIYSMTNLVSFEPYVDSTINYFFKRLEEVHDISRESCDLALWLQWFAFDVMGEITFSKRLGFLEKAHDVDGIISNIARTFQYICWVGQMPWLEKLWIKNTTVNRMLPARTAPVISFALARAAERVGEEGKFTGEEPSHLINSRDFLSRFLEAKQKDPTIPDWFLTAWTTSNILAGSDTTAISLRSIIYYVLKHPRSLEKLTNELRQAKQEGRLSATVTWKEAQNLEYLDACIKEAGRLHPATGLVLERVVPSGGMNICGKHFKAGTVVGMNAWVVHRDKDVFGEDAFEWSPERWLGDKSRRQAMERSLLTFGHGHRSCIGKNISHLEIYKLIPTLFARYQMQLTKPAENWRVTNNWLVIQNELNVNMQQRPGK